jgi:hypothetical protein
MKAIYNIILPVASRGLLNDADILETLIKSIIPNISVRIISKEKGTLGLIIKTIAFLINCLLRRKQTSFHLEEIQPFFVKLSKYNFFIPNPEWLRGKTLKQMNSPSITTLCKTHYAVEQLAEFSSSIQFMGFTSKDRTDTTIQKDFNKYIHIAGKSPQKGTLPLLKLWSKKTDWPELIVITTTTTHVEFNKFSNIKIINSFIEESELNKFINECGVHICPSEAEGFGHSIVEALAVSSCVLTTNGPPMSELLPSKEGGISWVKKGKRYCNDIYYVDEDSLALTIEKFINMSLEQKRALGEHSLKHYQQLTGDFHANLITLLQKNTGS